MLFRKLFEIQRFAQRTASFSGGLCKISQITAHSGFEGVENR